MIAHVVAKTYCVELDKKIFLKFLESPPENQLDFIEKLNNLTALNVRYDGMFGSYIWFELDTDAEHLLPQVLDVIQEYLPHA